MSFPMTQSTNVELLMFTIKMVDGGFQGATSVSVAEGRRREKGRECENGEVVVPK